MKNYLKFAPVFLLFIFTLSFLIHTNTALSQDLGRHIILGEIILKTHTVPAINLLSYTNSNFPFVNHHWLSEVIFYFFFTFFGILSITYFKIILIFAAVVFTFLASKKISSLTIATTSSFVIVPLLMSRTDERPEMFGYLFFSAYLYLYFSQRLNEKIGKRLYFLPLFQLIWVNTHITFIFGFLLLGIFVVDQYFLLAKKAHLKPWLKLIGITCLFSLINPQGAYGLLFPFFIFTNYGYSIQENQNLFFLSSLTSNIYIKIFWFQSFVLLLCALFSFFSDINKTRLRKNLIYYALFILFFIGSVIAIRNIPFFVFSSVLALSYFLTRIRTLISKYYSKYEWLFSYLTPIILSGCLIWAIVIITSNKFYDTFDQPKRFELKVEDSYKDGADFFLENKLKGPILNNFDIGGYLDYRLYPEKVFVDNRPDAFPAKFFDLYKESLSDLTKTEHLLRRYNIQTIIFSHTDATPWAQEFFKNSTKLKDYNYAYLDTAILIMAKNFHTPLDLQTTLQNQIDQTQNYQDLLALSNIALLLGKEEISNIAMEKAYIQNPSSCSIRLQKGIQDLSSPYDFIKNRGVSLLKTTRICPYSNNIKTEVSNILRQFSSY